MSKHDIKHNAKINNNAFKIIEVKDKYIVAKPISPYFPESSGAHICFNTGNHHFDHFDGRKPLFISQYYNQVGSIFVASMDYYMEMSVKDNDLIILPKKPISELNYLQKNGNLKLSANANGWIIMLAKNKETIEEVKEKIAKYEKNSRDFIPDT